MVLSEPTEAWAADFQVKFSISSLYRGFCFSVAQETDQRFSSLRHEWNCERGSSKIPTVKDVLGTSSREKEEPYLKYVQRPRRESYSLWENEKMDKFIEYRAEKHSLFTKPVRMSQTTYEQGSHNNHA